MDKRKFNLKDYSRVALVLLVGNKIVDAQVVYTDLDPDSILAAEYSDIDFDLDNNLIGDFKFRKFPLVYTNTSDIICYTSIYLGIRKLNAGNSIIGFDNVYWNDLIQPLNYGANINSEAEFNSDTFQLLSIKRREVSCVYGEPEEPWVYFNLGGWFTHQDEDRYIGVKFKNEAADCYYYGWIRCVISDSLEKITIKDYAYNSNCGGGIQAGMLTSSINESNAPEPIIVVQNNMLNITIKGNYIGADVIISNLVGQTVNTATISAEETAIQLHGLSAGMYLVSVKKNEQIYVKKIVVN